MEGRTANYSSYGVTVNPPKATGRPPEKAQALAREMQISSSAPFHLTLDMMQKGTNFNLSTGAEAAACPTSKLTGGYDGRGAP